MIGPHLITPYRSQPSVRPVPVRRDVGWTNSGRLMQVAAGQSDDGTQGYRHLKTDSQKSGSYVTGHFAPKASPLVPTKTGRV